MSGICLHSQPKKQPFQLSMPAVTKKCRKEHNGTELNLNRLPQKQIIVQYAFFSSCFKSRAIHLGAASLVEVSRHLGT